MRVFVFSGSRPFAWSSALALAPNLYLLALGPNLYLYPGQDFTIITTATCTIATTTNNNNKKNTYNKRYLHGSKIRIKWPFKCIVEKAKSCFSKFVSVMVNVSLKREVLLKKLTDSCF